MIYFTADYHLGHTAIIDSCDRPFKSVQQMDKVIILNHNSVVHLNDDVYLIGDLSLATKTHRGTLEQYIHNLNGRIHLIVGNHDIRDCVFLHEIGIYSIHYPYLEVEEFICIHDPAASCTDRSRTFLHGHIHTLFSRYKNCVNVGVDVNNFTPVSIESIRKNNP
jgi:calcineurin-like phosphoesterase family protein